MKQICVKVYYPSGGGTMKFPGWWGFYKDVFSCVTIRCNLCDYRFRCYTSDSLLLDFEEALELYTRTWCIDRSSGKNLLERRIKSSIRYDFTYDL